MGSNGTQARTDAKQRAFLAALRETGNITRAAEAAGMDRRRHYDWLDADPTYRERFESTMEEAGDLLEAEARRRAVEGTAEPVFYQGKAVGAVRKYSDTLLIFLLKGAKPGKYADRRKVEHSGKIQHEEGDPFDLLRDKEVAGALDRALASRATSRPLAEPGCSSN